MLQKAARSGVHETGQISLCSRRRVLCAALIWAAFLLGLGRLGGSRIADASNSESSASAASVSAEQSAEVKLGARLFHDDRFSSPKGDFLSSCSRCHQFDQDPQGLHAYNDLLNRSWQPFRIEDPRREAARNAPVLLDSGVMPRLHYDGEFTSLEDLIKGTLSGRTMGWLPNERDQAFDFVRKIVIGDTGDDSSNAESYGHEFKAAYRVEVANLKRDKLIELVSRAMAAYVRTLKTSRATPYDELIKLNGIPDGPAAGETPRDYSAGVISKVVKLQAAGLLRLPKGFDRAALTGMKIFFRTDGARAAGNCAVCHLPPYFTDFSFHNLGISQTDYDRVHGEGSFAALKIPGEAAVRPIEHFRRFPMGDDPSIADLGYWNFADPDKSNLKGPGESSDSFLRRMIATFKTPTLRDLAYSGPYMHDGMYSSVEEAINVIEELSEKARAGKVRSNDTELSRIRISSGDIPPLIAFLKTLNEDLRREYHTPE